MKFNAYIKDEYVPRIHILVDAYRDMGVNVIKTFATGIIFGETFTKPEMLLLPGVISVRVDIDFDYSTLAWFNLIDSQPTVAGYYFVKFASGEIDEKPYRIRGEQVGFLSEEPIIAWAVIPDDFTYYQEYFT